MDMKTLFSFYLLAAAIQDWRTYYFSKWWFVPSLWIGALWLDRYGWKGENVVCAIYFCLPGIFAWKKGWMGSADCWFLFYFGILLGWRRMSVAVCIAVAAGCLLVMKKKESYIPFVSCLCLGVWIAYWKGYWIFSHIFLNLLSGGAVN